MLVVHGVSDDLNSNSTHPSTTSLVTSTPTTHPPRPLPTVWTTTHRRVLLPSNEGCEPAPGPPTTTTPAVCPSPPTRDVGRLDNAHRNARASPTPPLVYPYRRTDDRRRVTLPSDEGWAGSHTRRNPAYPSPCTPPLQRGMWAGSSSPPWPATTTTPEDRGQRRRRPARVVAGDNDGKRGRRLRLATARPATTTTSEDEG
ncbi:hypothetical protein BJ912DRAFT_1103819 [Pholiota molesta]|nr:hypothetical protein BJ912DRAFT_1103819 [Pholiota molesta]